MSNGGKTALLIGLVVLVGVIGSIVFFRRGLIPSPFHTEITRQFIASLPRVSDAGLGRLEVATAEATETFYQENTQWIGWGWASIPSGTTKAFISVPVVYRYHVRLADPWKVETKGQLCVIQAPALRPTLPPAIRTDRIQKWAENGWARWDKQEMLDELEAMITPTIEHYAKSKDHINLAREKARITIAQFGKTFLLREGRWSNNDLRIIKVVFADELPVRSLDRIPLTIELTTGAE